MRIDSITLNNFRIYKGEQKISFSQSERKNLFVVAGENGFGKTTLLTSMIWCLYGRLMSEVDDKYKQEILASFGYKSFAQLNLNKSQQNKRKLVELSEKEIRIIKRDGYSFIGIKGQKLKEICTYSVTIEFSNVLLPSIPCKTVSIKRVYDVLLESEDVYVYIDGKENELTKEVGPDIFINDFLLSKEIAKFFFFDSEKIVSLAEMRTIEDKRKLGQAYSEVLGLKRYEDLKSNLENLRIKFRRKSSDLADREKLNRLIKETEDLQKIITHLNSQIVHNDIEVLDKKQLSDQYQEKLIREGNSITIEELHKLKKLRDDLKEKEAPIKSKLKELLDLAPLAIAGEKLLNAYKQMELETKKKENSLNHLYINQKLDKTQEELLMQIHKVALSDAHSAKIVDTIKSTFRKNYFDVKAGKKVENQKILLDLTPNEQSEFKSIYENIKFSYNLQFRQAIREDRNTRMVLGKIIKKIDQAESNENDLLIKEIRAAKTKIDNGILMLEKENRKLSEEIGKFQRDLTVKSKLLAELAKRVSVDETDKVKDHIAERLINTLETFLTELKLRKKSSLEVSIKYELNRLMHKKDFVKHVNVQILEDIVEIQLFDNENLEIKKESLSKGEQQLYATSILKALVDESEIKFPVFIDSPLQKFDKRHSNSIISKFYPSISDQVIIFPLIEKELSQKEYNLMLHNVQDAYLIKNTNNSSYFKAVSPPELFKEASKSYVYTN